METTIPPEEELFSFPPLTPKPIWAFLGPGKGNMFITYDEKLDLYDGQAHYLSVPVETRDMMLPMISKHLQTRHPSQSALRGALIQNAVEDYLYNNNTATVQTADLKRARLWYIWVNMITTHSNALPALWLTSKHEKPMSFIPDCSFVAMSPVGDILPTAPKTIVGVAALDVEAYVDWISDDPFMAAEQYAELIGKFWIALHALMHDNQYMFSAYTTGWMYDLLTTIGYHRSNLDDPMVLIPLHKYLADRFMEEEKWVSNRHPEDAEAIDEADPLNALSQVAVVLAHSRKKSLNTLDKLGRRQKVGKRLEKYVVERPSSLSSWLWKAPADMSAETYEEIYKIYYNYIFVPDKVSLSMEECAELGIAPTRVGSDVYRRALYTKAQSIADAEVADVFNVNDSQVQALATEMVNFRTSALGRGWRLNPTRPGGPDISALRSKKTTDKAGILGYQALYGMKKPLHGVVRTTRKRLGVCSCRCHHPAYDLVGEPVACDCASAAIECISPYD